ncbi:MAG: patatin-like phospholipase family protein, partial [Longimicrobiales bacterium]
QFAVRWMGEPPLGASSPVDRNDVLRRLYYWEAPTRHQKIQLGRAVAASACVPALFDPVELDGLFPDQIVRLVDGGVHDNQGITGLLEQECTVVIVSDASGQANVLARPSGEIVSVPMRANNILMARVREAQFRELDALRRSTAVRNLVFLHLKKDLDARQVDWLDSQDKWSPPDEARLPNTRYGIPKTVQRLLAGIRTDLDSFTDREAYSLMLSGYEMAVTDLREALPRWTEADEQPVKWRFKEIEPTVKRETGQDIAHAELLRQLTVSAARGAKIWRLSRALRWTAGVALITLLGTGIVFRQQILDAVPLRLPLSIAAVYAAVAALAWLGHRLTRTGKSFTAIATALLIVPFGALAATVYLLFFDPVFLLKGAVDRTERHRYALQVVDNATLTVVIVALTILVALAVTLWLVLSGPVAL